MINLLNCSIKIYTCLFMRCFICTFLYYFIYSYLRFCRFEIPSLKYGYFTKKNSICHGSNREPLRFTPCPASHAVYKRLSTTSEGSNSHPSKRTPEKKMALQRIYFSDSMLVVGSECVWRVFFGGDTQFYSFLLP